jgi:hypothetical protein
VSDHVWKPVESAHCWTRYALLAAGPFCLLGPLFDLFPHFLGIEQRFGGISLRLFLEPLTKVPKSLLNRR